MQCPTHVYAFTYAPICNDLRTYMHSSLHVDKRNYKMQPVCVSI